MEHTVITPVVGKWLNEALDSTRDTEFPRSSTNISGPSSVVGIATGYGLDGPGIESRWGRDFPQLSRPATLREERKLRVFENMVLRRIFGPRRDEVTGEWRRLHNEELNDLYS